jgi:hypothetical protein
MDGWALSGWFVGAAGLAVAIYETWFKDTSARLRYDFKRSTQASLPQDAEHIGLTYKGEPVPRISRVRVGFVNAGRQRINRADVERPVSIELLDREATLIDVSGDAVQIDQHTVEVDVTPLTPGERRHVTLWHTGDMSADLQVSGGIANLPRGLEGPRARRLTANQRFYFFLTLTFGLLLVMFSLAAFDVSDSEWNMAFRIVFSVAVSLSTTAALVLAGIAYVWTYERMARRLRRRKVFPD